MQLTANQKQGERQRRDDKNHRRTTLLTPITPHSHSIVPGGLLVTS